MNGYILKHRGRGLELLYTTGKETRTPKAARGGDSGWQTWGLHSLTHVKEKHVHYTSTHITWFKKNRVLKIFLFIFCTVVSNSLIKTPFNHTVNVQQGCSVPGWLNVGGSRHLPSQHFTPPKKHPENKPRQKDRLSRACWWEKNEASWERWWPVQRGVEWGGGSDDTFTSCEGTNFFLMLYSF